MASAFSIPSRKTILAVILTLALSAAGGGIAMLLDLPAGWLMGGALAVTLAAMFGAPVAMPDRLRDVVFVLIGMSMGASVAPDSLTLIASWPISIAALALELVIIVAATGWMLTKLFRLDPGTAYLSSFPGHLSFVLGIAATGVGNSRQIVIIQVIRILMLDCLPADRSLSAAGGECLFEPAAACPARGGMRSGGPRFH
jgi:membrane AbrB-like protein